MKVFISGKQSLLILLAGLCLASGSVLLLNRLFSEPRLGVVYDLLLNLRPSPPVSQEILLIETDEIIESGDVFSVIMALSEFDASTLLIEVPVLGTSSNRIHSDDEIQRRLRDEYVLLGRNINNLFESIRGGSISPLESQEYVDNLVELANRGRDRLSAALARQEEAGAIQTARAARAFGNVLEAVDLRAISGNADGDSEADKDLPWYARPRLDPDGKLRRVIPLLPAGTEHIVYRGLKHRWTETAIVYDEQGPLLVAGEFIFSLDENGGILTEKPRKKTEIKRLSIERFREYTAADFAMRRLLKDAETLGIYPQLKPEQIPPFLYDYALDLRNDLLTTPSAARRATWISARSEYFKNLSEMLNGPIESKMTGSYEEIIAAEKLKPDGILKLLKQRDELVLAFAGMREKYEELEKLRSAFAVDINSAFCIMGPNLGDAGAVESSALLANALLTGNHIRPGQSWHIIFFSILSVFIILIIIHSLRPGPSLICGTILSLLCAGIFGTVFIFTSYWIDPQIPALSAMIGTLVMFIISFMIQRRGQRLFRLAYGQAVNKNCLKQLLRSGQPPISETLNAKAAIIAVKNSEFLKQEKTNKPSHAAKTQAEFRNAVIAAFKKADATIIGCEGDTVIACFGSPLERIYLETTKTQYGDDPGAHKDNHPAAKAVSFIEELIHDYPDFWYYGVDFGECAFFWSAETGYSATGSSVARARILSTLGSRHHTRVLSTLAVREKINQPARKLQAPGEFFYDLFPTKNTKKK